MATTTLTNQFKQDCFNGKVNFAGTSPLTYKMLLIKVSPSGTYDATLSNVGTPGTGTPSTTNVGTDEVTGTGYTPGGFTMTGVTVSLQSGTATVDWSTNPNWTNSSISAVAAVLYESVSKNTVAVFDFGGTITDTAGTFTVNLPPSGASTSAVRFA